MSEREKYPSEAAERFQVRLPEGMRDQLRDAAEANNRSMNAEIVARLSRSFWQWPVISLPEELENRLKLLPSPYLMEIERSVTEHLIEKSERALAEAEPQYGLILKELRSLIDQMDEDERRQAVQDLQSVFSITGSDHERS